LLGSRGESIDDSIPWAPGLDPRAGARPALLTLEEVALRIEQDGVEVLAACLPHGAWSALATRWPALAALPAHIVDLSSDHRDGGAGYAYGLPEAFRAALQRAPRVANPGCYPTAFALALLPAARADWLGGPIAVTALSGLSGAGRSATLRTSFV